MDRFIRVNGKDFSFEEVAKALGLEVAPHLDPVQISLCQRVDDGVLVAKGAFFDKDDYPGIDVELELPPEKDSLPVMISRCEQPRAEGEERGLRNFCYSRENEYFMYFDVDTRTDELVDTYGLMVPQVVVSGSRLVDVEVYEENSFVKYKGPFPDVEQDALKNQKNIDLDANGAFEDQMLNQEPGRQDVALCVGMVGTLKNLPEIKKSLRGKAFEITGVNAEDGFAACTIEGENGTYSVHVSQVENLKMPERNLQEDNLRGYQSADISYPEYPHDFGNGYKVQTFYANALPADYVSDVGDIYDVKEDAEEEHPDEDIVVGFCVVASDGMVPEGCNDFNRTVEEAIQDYEQHVLPGLHSEKTDIEEVLQSAKARSVAEHVEKDGRSALDMGLA